MHSDAAPSVPRINARPTDVIDIFNLKHYPGPNPYLNSSALVFDFVLLEDRRPLPLAHYLPAIGAYYPHLREDTYLSHAHLFSRVVAEVNNLEMDLHLDKWILKNGEGFTRIAIEALHGRTTRGVIYTVWDWFEAITLHEEFGLEQQLQSLQQTFRKSVYGGPTVYALWQAAQRRGIPTMFLWEEELVQYGYGRRQVRGAGTTFDRDSRLDSDFTTRKDDCKAFLSTLGFPVPRGHVVTCLAEALEVAERIGYPVVVKPVAGHKGIGVTAHILTPAELEFACEKAVDAIPLDQPVRLIVESHIIGTDFRLLCVEGRFVAAVERRPPSVTGDGLSTIQQLVEKENASAARSDTPTSPLGKIQMDDAMSSYLAEQNLTLASIPAAGHRVYLRKVANLSAGGVSYDATRTIHPDNIILAQDIAQYFRLTCLGIDVMTTTLAKSWKEGNLGIIEINASPGIFMHLKPAVGDSVDVPSTILQTFFPVASEASIPILTFNRISLQAIQEIIDRVLYRHPSWVIGAVSREGVLINRATKVKHPHYNVNVQNLLRNPKLDLLIAEYCEDVLEEDGMRYQNSAMVVLEEPTETEMMLVREGLEPTTVILKQGIEISIQSQGYMEHYHLGPGEPFKRVYLKEIAKVL